jgi:hypothetical protein
MRVFRSAGAQTHHATTKQQPTNNEPSFIIFFGGGAHRPTHSIHETNTVRLRALVQAKIARSLQVLDWLGERYEIPREIRVTRLKATCLVVCVCASVKAFHFRLPTKRLKRSCNSETLTVEERI